jgi:hypothetical protein
MPNLFAVTASTTLNLRSSPELRPDNIIGAMPHGHIVTKLEDADPPFVKVSTTLAGETLTGFCSSNFLEPAETEGSGGTTVVTLTEIDDGVRILKLANDKAVFFTSDMDIDVDGAPNAYGPNESGLERNKNGKNKKGQFVAVVTDDNGNPIKQSTDDPFPGMFISTTTLFDPTKPRRSTLRYVNGVQVPYIVIPGQLVGGLMQMGDPALVIDLKTGEQVKAIVADAGPTRKTGEASAFLAAKITKQQTPVASKKSFSNPRDGGTDERRFRYIIFPGRTLSWPQTNDAIETAVDDALADLSAAQLKAITTA